jgi:curved DNA-binding protein CbpA
MTKDFEDYYSVLNVQRSAESVVIAAAYRALAKQYHPDTWRGERSESEVRMRKINEAYSVLSNRDKRRQYDEFLNGGVDDVARRHARQTQYSCNEFSKQGTRTTTRRESPHAAPEVYASSMNRPIWRRIVGLAIGASLILPGFYLLGLWEGNIIIAVWLFAFGAGVLCDELADWPRRRQAG